MALDAEWSEITAESGNRQTIPYGIWKSVCCGDEIVLYRDAILPMCSKHPDTLTEWDLISTRWTSKEAGKDKADPTPRRKRSA
jgi:hypothetical protein